MQSTLSWLSNSYSKVSLDAVGLVAIADLNTAARRTALTGTATILDAFVLCPGLHRQLKATELHGAEYPACAAMTTGYVFRVENPATVSYLQRIGKTGHLTTLCVSSPSQRSNNLLRALRKLYDSTEVSAVSTACFLVAVSLTLTGLTVMILFNDWWGVTVVTVLVCARLINVIVVRCRAVNKWHGATEPGVHGDLLILLSQDRWIRVEGLVDDLKAVTSGQWLREPTFIEEGLTAFATLLVYLDVALTSNVHRDGQLLLLVLLFSSAALLGVTNQYTSILRMHGRIIKVDRKARKYERRLDLANELVRETGRDDWAIRMGMIPAKKGSTSSTDDEGPKIM